MLIHHHISTSQAIVQAPIRSLKNLLDQLRTEPEPANKTQPPLFTTISNHKFKILCIGDSITKGFYDAHHYKKVHPYSWRLNNLIADNFGRNFAQVVNKGVGGETVSESLKYRLIRELQKTHYDMVIVLGGVNDLVQIDVVNKVNLPREVTSMLLQASQYVNETIALTILEAYPIKKKLKYITMRAFSDKRKEVNRRIRRLSSKSIGICDTATLFPQLSLSDQEFSKLWREDRVHPTPEGYDKLAGIIYTCIEERLTQRTRN